VKLAQSLTQTFDGDSTHRDVAASSTYDDTTGNVTAREAFGEVIGNSDGTWTDTGSDSATTTFTYAASTTLSSLSLPARELVVDQTGATVKDTKWYYDGLALGYASSGNRTKEESLISGSTYASTTATYNAYGLVATATDSLGNATAFTYDGYNLFPITITNALGQQKLVSYDYSSGKAATTTDANNQTVVTVYDNLDRPILEKIPDFTTPSTLVTKSAYIYTDATTTVSSVQKTDYLSNATSTDSFVYTDGLGRALQTKSEGEVASGWITKDSFYNTIGAVASDTVPYFTSASSWSTPTTTASRERSPISSGS
jgi:YD repeat-containing protein